jgi:hypothetical protein
MANFRSTSRYSRAIVTTNRDNKPFILLRRPLELEPDQGDTFFEVTQEVLQRPDLIAQTFYGSVDYWWAIYEFNGVRDPLFQLKLGQVLRIPDLGRLLQAIARLEE